MLLSFWKGCVAATSISFSPGSGFAFSGIKIDLVDVDSICIQFLPSFHCFLAVCVNSLHLKLTTSKRKVIDGASSVHPSSYYLDPITVVGEERTSRSLFYSIFIYVVNRIVYWCVKWIDLRLIDTSFEVVDGEVVCTLPSSSNRMYGQHCHFKSVRFLFFLEIVNQERANRFRFLTFPSIVSPDYGDSNIPSSPLTMHSSSLSDSSVLLTYRFHGNTARDSLAPRTRHRCPFSTIILFK